MKGLALRWILPALVIGLLAAPGLLMAPDLSMADRSASPDAGSFVIVGMVMLMGLVVISALIGGAVGVFLRHRQKQSEAVRMFWTPR